MHISGAISGAITDPFSKEALEHAEKYYEEIRHRKDDVDKIAKFTGYTSAQILRVKNYLFIDEHILSDGTRRFDPCFEIAESWQRPSDMQDYVQPHDLLLIPHERMEASLVDGGMSQYDAHLETCKTYNYPKETEKFYEELQTKKHTQIGKGKIVSGGITHQGRDDWDLYL